MSAKEGLLAPDFWAMTARNLSSTPVMGEVVEWSVSVIWPIRGVDGGSTLLEGGVIPSEPTLGEVGW